MGEAVDIVPLAHITAPYAGTGFDLSASAQFRYKCHIVGIDVVEVSDNYYDLGLVCIHDTYGPMLGTPTTRFFKITNGQTTPPLNNEAMYIGAAQIRTWHDSFVSDPQNMHVDMGRIYTLHVFEEST